MIVVLYILVSSVIAQYKPVGNLLSHLGLMRLAAPSYCYMNPIFLSLRH